MRGNIQGLLAQAQKMQKNVERLQAELGNIEVTGEAGAGAVKITITCKHEARRVEIDPKLLSGDPDDKEMLEDLVAAAINDAAHKAEALSQQKMKEATAGLPLPPGSSSPSDCIKKQENPVRMALLSAIWRRDFLSFAFSDLFL